MKRFSNEGESNAIQQLGLSQAKVYQLIELEGLPTIKIGRCTRVLYGSLVQWAKERERNLRS